MCAHNNLLDVSLMRVYQVEGLKKAVIDNQNYIKNELSKEIAQKALDQDWMKINEWNNRLKDASVKLKDTGYATGYVQQIRRLIVVVTRKI